MTETEQGFEFSSESYWIGGHAVTAFETGHVEFEASCSCGHFIQIDMDLEDLAEIVRKAKAFRGRRAVRKKE